MSRSIRAAAAAFLLTLTLLGLGVGLLLADVNTRAVAFGDLPAYTNAARLPSADTLADTPLPAPTRLLLWLWEGEQWVMSQFFS